MGTYTEVHIGQQVPSIGPVGMIGIEADDGSAQPVSSTHPLPVTVTGGGGTSNVIVTNDSTHGIPVGYVSGSTVVPVDATHGLPVIVENTVLVSGSVTATISGTPAVTATITGTPNVAVTNTPAVTISGTPTVSALITGTPNVAVTNTPSVTISGTPTVSASITGTPNVAITNTPTVNATCSGTVAISGTVATSEATLDAIVTNSALKTSTILNADSAVISATKAFTAAAQTLVVTLNGANIVTCAQSFTANVAIVVLETSFDGGTTYFTARGYQYGTQITDGAASSQMGGTGANIIVVNVAGATHFRARCSSYSSGTLNLQINTSTSVPFFVENSQATIGVDSVLPGSSGTSLGKQGNGSTSSNDTGVSILAERIDALVSINANAKYTRPRVNTVGALYSQLVPGLANGNTSATVISANTTNGTNVKNAAGQLYGLILSNNNATVAYFKLYNKASTPTVGTDTPVATIMIPANGTVITNWDTGWAFGTGLGYGITTGMAVADTGAVAAAQVAATLIYT